MSILSKIEKLDVRIVHASMLIVIAAALLAPIGLPIRVSSMTNILYNRIEGLTPGSRVAFVFDINPGLAAEFGPLAGAVLTHVMRRPLKVVILNFQADGPLMFQSLRQLKWFEIPESKKYGVDYVYLGYLAGVSVAMAQTAADLHKAYSKDFYGTPLDQLPLMNEVNNAKDFAIAIDATGGTTEGEDFLRQWHTTYGIPMAWVFTSMMVPPAMPYYPNQVFAIVGGPRSAAEYELMIRRPMLGLQTTDALSLTQILILIFIAAGEVALLGKARVKGGQNK